MLCAINFDLGRENWFPIKPVEDAKKILIIGGGPAGMEAARIAALRGFKVTLLEKSNELGGQVLAASATPLKGELRNIVNYLKNQLNKLGVDVKMGFEATPEAVKELRPDIVIVATGSKPIIPRVAQGKPNVFTQEEVLTGKVKIGNNVAVWGGEIGCETAISLAEEGKKVTIIDEGTLIERFGIPLPPIRRTWVLSKLLELYSDEKLNVLAETAIRDITSEGILLESRDGKKQVLAVDSIVVAKGRVPNRKLVEELRKDFKNVHEIGDCVKPRNIPAAIEDANYVVRCRI
jgi:NADPH-dependent 2,4-dienoyl-CoA reductase/sulfur reductase-like enzyme